MATLTYTERLTTVTCVCGMNYAIPETLNERMLEKRGPGGVETYCPSGHKWFYVGKTEAEQVREQLEAERRRSASLTSRLDQETASHRSTKGQLTKAKRRAANGVCPCCKRTFANVARHVKSKHPEHVETLHA